MYTDGTESLGQATGENANGLYDLVIDQTIDQRIVQGPSDLMYYEYNADGTITEIYGDGGGVNQDITIQQPVYDVQAFNDYNLPDNISQDDFATNLGNNITVIGGPDENGWFEITQDFVQNFDQDIVQDVYYEIDIVQDFIQTQEINQDIIVDVVRTATATRLVSE